MKIIYFIVLLLPISLLASVVGISTHPLSDEARVLSAEMTGFMSGRNELGGGLRYTQEMYQGRILDFNVSGGQLSRGIQMGSGMDFEILAEDLYQPRVSVKSFLQYQKFEDQSYALIGAAPTLRSGLSLSGQEFFPYVALPSGIRLDTVTNEFVYSSSVTLGASLPLPNAGEKVLLSFEANKNFGASSDYVGCLVSWIWK
jgi:hypothetical protein